MHAYGKYVEKGLAVAANGAWFVFSRLNQLRPNPSFTPLWSDKPLLKSWQKTKPPLGWPRRTDSLCPVCVLETRQEILDGKKDLSVLLTEKVGEIKATILEREGRILMVKDCHTHGHFEDVVSIDPSKRTRRGLPGTKQIVGTFFSSPACGSRTYLITTFDARKCASFLTPLRKERSRSVPTTPELVGAKSWRKCT